MSEPKYKRMLLKISGEALAGEKHQGLDFEVIGSVCDVVKKCAEAGVQVGIVIGGGNFWRGLKDGNGKMERTRADHMGMLATVMNCLAVADVMEQKHIPVRVMTAVEMLTIAEHYTREKAIELKVFAADVVDASSEGKRTDFADAAELAAYLGDKLSRCEVVLEEPSDVAQAWAFVTCSYQTSNSRTVVYAKEVEGWDSRPSE